MLANTVFTLHIQSIGASNLKVSIKTAIHNMSSPICCFVIQACLLALWISDSYGNQIPSMISPIALRKWDSDPGAQSGMWRSAINIFMIPFLLFKNAYAIPFRNIWLTAKMYTVSPKPKMPTRQSFYKQQTMGQKLQRTLHKWHLAITLKAEWNILHIMLGKKLVFWYK